MAFRALENVWTFGVEQPLKLLQGRKQHSLKLRACTPHVLQRWTQESLRDRPLRRSGPVLRSVSKLLVPVAALQSTAIAGR